MTDEPGAGVPGVGDIRYQLVMHQEIREFPSLFRLFSLFSLSLLPPSLPDYFSLFLLLPNVPPTPPLVNPLLPHRPFLLHTFLCSSCSLSLPFKNFLNLIILEKKIFYICRGISSKTNTWPISNTECGSLLYNRFRV